MATFIDYNRSIVLSNNPNYSNSLTLEGKSFTAYFLWNERIERYCMSLYDSQNSPVFEGMPLHSKTITPFDSLLTQAGLNGYFMLSPVNRDVVESRDTYYKWADYYTLMYVVTVRQ